MAPARLFSPDRCETNECPPGLQGVNPGPGSITHKCHADSVSPPLAGSIPFEAQGNRIKMICQPEEQHVGVWRETPAAGSTSNIKHLTFNA